MHSRLQQQWKARTSYSLEIWLASQLSKSSIALDSRMVETVVAMEGI